MQHRTRIKFCGITRVDDALAAAQAGADAIGMLLHAQSRRLISRETARQIVAALPPFVTPVGLFVDAPPQLLKEVANDLGIRHIQLHGSESPLIVDLLPGRLIIKAVRISRGAIAEALAPWREVSNLGGLLLETGGLQQSGGSGIENDWDAIHQHQQQDGFKGFARIIVAGGLRPDNVAEVVRLLRPWAVDVSSGIEDAPGIKSKRKMEAFAAAVREADASAT